MHEKPVVIITGASRGIGFAATQDLLSRNWRVVMVARGQDQLENSYEQLLKTYDRHAVSFISGDVSTAESVKRILEHCLSTFGRINALINNAAIIEPIGHLHEQDSEAWMNLLDVNVGGIFNISKIVIPLMLEQGGGCIVNLSSGAAHNAITGWSAYCVSKAATLMLTRCIHNEYGHRGIRTHAFIPGAVSTPMLETAFQSFENNVTKMDKDDLLPPELPGRCLGWIVAKGDKLKYGSEESIRDPNFRSQVGLPEGYKW